MSISNYLKNLEPQEERTEQELKIQSNPNLENIIKTYEKWIDDKYQQKNHWIDLYKNAKRLTKKLQYSSKDITEFSLKLKKYEKLEYFSETGSFISALINNSKEKNFEIITESIKNEIDLIGYNNTKNILIKGNVGSHTGNSMKKGTIKIYGNVKDCTGVLMTDGRIKITGDAKEGTGTEMSGGTIEIQGTAGTWTGHNLHKGIIIVQGKLVKNIKKVTNNSR